MPMDKGQNQYTIQGLVIPVQRSPQIKSPNHPNKTQIKIFTKYCHYFLSPCKPSCPSCGKPHKALQQTATMIFVGNHKKNNNIYWFELFTQYKNEGPTMNSYSRTTLNLNQVGKIIVTPVPFIYITCTFPAFPMCFHATFSSQGVVASIISRLPKRS